MSSLLVFNRGIVQEPSIYSTTIFERIIVLCSELREFDDQYEHPHWYVNLEGILEGPFFAFLFKDGGLSVPLVSEVGGAFKECDIDACLAWEMMFAIERDGSPYKYCYTIECDGVLANAAFSWVDEDIKTRCESRNGGANLEETYEVESVSRGISSWGSWRDGALVKEGSGYRIWLNLC
jgi:hypothetical protein